MIDIIIPHYNDLRVLDSIRSIVSHPDNIKMRILLMDAYSPPILKSKIKRMLRVQDLHIEKKDKGIFDGINNGLKVSQSEWIGWIGSDDILCQDFRLDFLEKDIDAFFASTAFFDAKKKKLLRFFYPYLKKSFITVPHFSSFVKRNVAKKLIFNNNLETCADFFYFLKLRKSVTKFECSKVISTFMSAGGTSNSSVFQIICTNLQILNILMTKHNSFLSIYYTLLKIYLKIFGKLDVFFRRIFNDKEFILLEKSLINFFGKSGKILK